MNDQEDIHFHPGQDQDNALPEPSFAAQYFASGMPREFVHRSVPYPPPGYAPPVFYPGMPIAQPERGRDLAIAGFVIGIVSLFTWFVPFISVPMPIVGIILSALGLRSPSRRIFAIIGLILSIIGLVIEITLIALIIGFSQ